VNVQIQRAVVEDVDDVRACRKQPQKPRILPELKDGVGVAG
jgi:hypothetical protein